MPSSGNYHPSVQIKHAVLSVYTAFCSCWGVLCFLMERKLYFECPSKTGFLCLLFYHNDEETQAPFSLSRLNIEPLCVLARCSLSFGVVQLIFKCKKTFLFKSRTFQLLVWHSFPTLNQPDIKIFHHLMVFYRSFGYSVMSQQTLPITSKFSNNFPRIDQFFNLISLSNQMLPQSLISFEHSLCLCGAGFIDNMHYAITLFLYVVSQCRDVQ